MELLTNSLQSGPNWIVPASLLRLLCAWVDSCPAVVQALLEPQHYMSLFAGVLTGGVGVQDPTLINLTAFLLGACLVSASLTDINTGTAYVLSHGTELCVLVYLRCCRFPYPSANSFPGGLRICSSEETNMSTVLLSGSCL